MNQNILFHSLPIKDVLREVKSNEVVGLSKGEAEKRLKEFGENEVKKGKTTSVLEIFLNQFKSLLVVALILAAILSIFMNEMLDAGVIIFVLIVNAIVGTFEEYKAERAIEALKKMSATSARVIRDGKQEKIYAKNLVPGDIILLEVGDRVPADARIIESFSLNIDESMLTGESVPAKKQVGELKEKTQIGDKTNMVFKDTIVTKGRAKCVVVKTGMKTEIGNIANLLEKEIEEETPLIKKLNTFMKDLSVVVLIGFVLVIILGYFVAGIGFEESVRLGIAQAVSFIPEGLPIVITVVLALGVTKMANKKSIIRKLTAVETLGSVTCVCTDKTGTLTKNEMTIKQVYTNNEFIEVSGEGYSIEGKIGYDDELQEDKNIKKLAEISVLCNDSSLDKKNNEVKIIGDPTEAALLILGEKINITKEKMDEENIRIGEIQFDSEKKYMSTFNKNKNKIIANVKGAPEKILKMCTHILVNGKVKKIDKKQKQLILDANKKMTNSALRVLGMAYKETKSISENELKELIFVGLVGMIDPPREEAKKAIKEAKEAGIRVIMITGDHELTAKSIAEQLGIIKNNDIVINGETLDELTEKELEKIVDKVSVYARTSSIHKTRIIAALKKKGNIIAMTGDGINDALALKKADVGIAMGIAGTEVTKESSDMILTDDNFASIISAIEEGRGVFSNIKKVINYLLGTNASEVLFLAIILLSGFILQTPLPIALIPIQILFVNLVTDGVFVITLAMEPKEKNIMQQPARNPKEPLLTQDMVEFIVLTAIIIAVGTLYVFYTELNSTNLTHARSMAFATIVFFQFFSAFNAKSNTISLIKNIFNNKYLWAATIVFGIIQVIVFYDPFMNLVLQTTPLSINDWIKVGIVASSVTIIFEIEKLIKNILKNREKRIKNNQFINN
ncbi:MAG TPA: HAD-IC family P-type ATPase [archaeon]|nr:HAD-IC family P-type ATPase [archaeon]